MASLFPAPQQYFDNNGDPLAGGKVYFYEAGTTTPKDTYTTQAGTIANANPVILDSAGRASIWGTGTYKEVVRTSADVLISTKDSVTLGNDINDGTVTNTMLANMAANTVKARSASTSGVPSDVALTASTLLGVGSTGNVAAISLSGGLSMSGAVLSSLSPQFISHRTGNYYPPANFGANPTTAFTTTVNRLTAVPFFVPETKTYTRIGVNIDTAVASNIRLGIYNNGAGVPSTLVLDAGVVSAGTTGLKEVTISQSLAAGTYWLAYVSDGTSQLSACQYGSVLPLLGNNPASILDIYTSLYVALTYGALPASFGTAIYRGAVAAPFIGLKV